MITAIAIKENETPLVIDRLDRSFEGTRRYLWTSTSILKRFGGNLRSVIREVMDILLDPEPSISILAYTDLWLSQSDRLDDIRVSGTLGIDRDEEDDSDDDDNLRELDSGSIGMLYALCHWYASHDLCTNRLYFIFEHGIPRALKRIPKLVIEESFLISAPISDTNQALSSLQPPMGDKLVVVGVIGKRGKTSTLRSFSNPKSVWMYCHEIVNCELGESPRMVRSLFETASGRQTPSMVLLDDADLILSTSGRIMREILEEICSCTSGGFSRGYFVYSALARKDVPDVLLANTNQFIDLDN